MRYTVGSISKQSGLAAQTIREYADRGMLDNDIDEQSRYRYFEAKAVNRTGVIRRMRMMGFSLSEVESIMDGVTGDEYASLLIELIKRQEKELDYKRDVFQCTLEHAENIKDYKNDLNKGELTDHPSFYCLDYRKNGELICSSESERLLLNEWMAQAVFMRNYSPYSEPLLHNEDADHIIGFLIDEKFSRYVTTSHPVYLRKKCRCARFFIRHDDHMHLLPNGPGFVLDFLEVNNLRIADEPFFVGEISFVERSEKAFYGHLYVPVYDTVTRP